MKSTFISLLALIVLLSFGCRKDDLISSPPDPAYMGGCSAIKSNSSLPNDNAGIYSAVIDGNCLDLQVSYGGGCETHRFDLVWDGTILESFPVQLNLQLTHDSNGDLCKAAILRPMSFNLARVRLHYYSTVVLRIHNPAGVLEQTVLYNY